MSIATDRDSKHQIATVNSPSGPSQQTLAGDRLDHPKDSRSSYGENFDYESKVWGNHEVDVSPEYLGALRLKYCLEDLLEVEGRVLEIGCGAGAMIRAIRRYRSDLRLFGCDISQNAIANAMARGNRISFDVADAYSLPFENESLDAVVTFDVLEHLADPARAISEASRVLKKGGVFHIFTPCEGELLSLHGVLHRLGWKAKRYYGGHIQQFTLKALRHQLEKSGFSVEKHQWSCHLINQVADVSYFSLLWARGKNTQSSVEGYLAHTEDGMWPALVQLMKQAIAVGTFYESRVLNMLPGSGAHILCNKL